MLTVTYLALLLMISPIILAGCAALTAIDDQPTAKKPTELYHEALDYYQSGKYAEAKERFHLFIGENPKSVLFKVALYYLGHCYQMTGDEKEAATLYSRVITTYGEDDFWGAQAMKRLKSLKTIP